MNIRMNLRGSPQQSQTMAFALHQALYVLQLPILELSDWVQEEIEKNPLLQNKAANFPQEPLPDPIASISLREHLLRQAQDLFTTHSERAAASFLIDSLDERGFLSEIKGAPYPKEFLHRIIEGLQTFDPPGIASFDLRGCYLKQLNPSIEPIAYTIVEKFYPDLLHGRFQLLQKKLKIDAHKLKKSIERIAKLQTRPTSGYEISAPSRWIPDLVVKEKEEGWFIEIEGEELCDFSFRKEYCSLTLKGEEKKTLREWIAKGKWMKRCLKRRKEILLRIGHYLLSLNKGYFEGREPFSPLSIKELADYLNVHTTTAWRAVSGKALASSQGMILLSHLFSDSLSSSPTKQLLKQLIDREDKKCPLSDARISCLLSKQGKPCARRTVAKYRKVLNIASACKRKIQS